MEEKKRLLLDWTSPGLSAPLWPTNNLYNAVAMTDCGPLSLLLCLWWTGLRRLDLSAPCRRPRPKMASFLR